MAVPGVPTGLALASITDLGLTASWSAVTGATSYTLQYRLTGGSTWTPIANIAGISQTVTGLDSAVEYDFQVEAINASGPSGFTATVNATTLPQPATPAILPTLGAWRANCGVNWMGMALVGDMYSGVIGLSDFTNFTEYGNPMRLLITSPPIQSDRKRVFIRRFEVDVQTGVALESGQGSDPQLRLDWSKDGGMTFGPQLMSRSMGKTGEYAKRLRWLSLGESRAWVLRLTCTDPVRRTIIGTYIDQAVGTG